MCRVYVLLLLLRVIMRKLREDDEENFHQELFRTLVGPKTIVQGQQVRRN